MITAYIYSIQHAFPNHKVSTQRLLMEVRASVIIEAVDHIDTSGDDCSIVFKAPLAPAEVTGLSTIVAAHSGEPLTPEEEAAAKPVTAVQRVFFSPNFCDPTTWYAGSQYASDEQAADSGDHTTYSLANPHLIDASHGKIPMEEDQWDEQGNSYPVKVKVNGNLQSEDTDYTVDYVKGQITFASALLDTDTVVVSYHYVSTGDNQSVNTNPINNVNANPGQIGIGIGQPSDPPGQITIQPDQGKFLTLNKLTLRLSSDFAFISPTSLAQPNQPVTPPVRTGLMIETRSHPKPREHTSSPLNIAVDGAGFFVVTDGNGSNYFTRQGMFKLDSKNRIVTMEDGYLVQGSLDGVGPIQPIIIPSTATLIVIGTDGLVTVTLPNQSTQQVGRISLAIFNAEEYLQPWWHHLYLATTSSGAAVFGTPGTGGHGTTIQGDLEIDEGEPLIFKTVEALLEMFDADYSERPVIGDSTVTIVINSDLKEVGAPVLHSRYGQQLRIRVLNGPCFGSTCVLKLYCTEDKEP